MLRAGRVSPRQQQGLNIWLKNYALTLSDTPWDLTSVFQNTSETFVEIGFGMGASLVTMAQNNPHCNYIGIEVHQAGVGSLAADLHEHNLGNVRIVSHDAAEVFQTQFTQNTLAGVQIFFPDPWHKKRHNKRRLIQAEFVSLVVEKLKTGGFIHCATDWQDYAEQMLEVLSAEPTLENQQPEGGYSSRPPSRPLTKFEQRGQRLGHGVWDLIFIKKVE